MLLVTSTARPFFDGWSPEDNTSLVDLYVFTLITGEIFYYSGGQIPLRAPFPGTDNPKFPFTLGPGFSRTTVKKQVGPQIDEITINLYANESLSIGFEHGGTLTWQDALRWGVFDGATCAVLRAVVSPPNVVQGTIYWFYGRVGDVRVGRTKITIKVKSLLDILTIQMPQTLFQAGCPFVYGGPMCGFDRVDGKSADGTMTNLPQVAITCGAASDQTILQTSFVPPISDGYDNGTVIATSGLNQGFSRTIAQIAAGSVYFFLPWIFPVQASVDTFLLQSGCPHTFTGCTQRKNTDRYGGFRWIPPPEVAV